MAQLKTSVAAGGKKKKKAAKKSKAGTAEAGSKKPVAPKKASVRPGSGEERIEIYQILVRFFRDRFFRGRRPAFGEDIRQKIDISHGAWIALSDEINHDGAVYAKKMRISSRQMGGARTIDDLVEALLAGRRMAAPVEAKAASAGPKPGRSPASTAAVPEGVPADVPAPKAKRAKSAPKAMRPRFSPGKRPILESRRGASDEAVEITLERYSRSDAAPSATRVARAPVEVGADSPFAETLNLHVPVAAVDPEPSFKFELVGEGVQADQVRWGEEFDLLFKYDAEASLAAAVAVGEHLVEIVKNDATLGIDIFAVGLTLTSGGAGRVVSFKNGKMVGDPPLFHLRAPTKADAGAAPHGVRFVFTVAGAMIYSSFLKIELVDKFASAPREAAKIDLDMAEVGDATVMLPRIGKLFVMTKGDSWLIHGDFDDVFLMPQSTTVISPASLNEAYRSVTLGEFTRIAGSAIWGNIDGNLQGKASDSASSLANMKATAAAGSRLYAFLAQDPVFKRALDLIEGLPEGSRFSIYSDGTAFPWELLYPLRYVVDHPPENYQPDRFWGRRFIIESLFVPTTGSEKPPAKRRQPGNLHVSMGYNSGIDSEEPWRNAERLLKPVRLQKDYFDAELQTRGGYFDTYEAIFETLSTPYVSSLIYYFCHGSANQLKFDGVKSIFDPMHIMGDSYPGWPVIFLNACDAADISPLSFFSFRNEFHRKKAAGIIAPSFPVPTLFAAVFAKAFMSAYTMGDAVGDILFRLRRELLAKNNPLGLWYSLQCPLDLRAPVVLPAPGV